MPQYSFSATESFQRRPARVVPYPFCCHFPRSIWNGLRVWSCPDGVRFRGIRLYTLRHRRTVKKTLKVTQKHQITASVVFEKVWQQPQEGCPLGLSRTASWGFNDKNLPATHRPVFLFVCSYFVSLFHGKKTSEWFPNNGRKILCARGN